MTQDVTDHECIADHCIACCPRALGYSDGFEQAKTIYKTSSEFDHRPIFDVDLTELVLFVLVFIVSFALTRAYLETHNASSSE